MYWIAGRQLLNKIEYFSILIIEQLRLEVDRVLTIDFILQYQWSFLLNKDNRVHVIQYIGKLMLLIYTIVAKQHRGYMIWSWNRSTVKNDYNFFFIITLWHQLSMHVNYLT